MVSNFHVKGYLLYKAINSQNVLSEAQVNFFLFCRKVIFSSQDIRIFVVKLSPDLPNPWRHAEYYYMGQGGFLNMSFELQLTKLGQLIDASKGNNFQKSFEQFGRLGPSSRSFSVH